MSPKEKVLKILHENDDVNSLSQARKILKQERALRKLTEHSQELGLYSQDKP